jgi:hypothetical protein
MQYLNSMNGLLALLQSLSRKKLYFLIVCLLGFTGVIDILTGVELSFSILYLVPVALATWMISRRAGTIVSISCAVVWYSADYLSSASYSTPLVPYWNATVMLGFFLSTTFILSARRDITDRENILAHDIQMRLLPAEMPDIPGFDIACAWRPATTVSGDYYDVIRTPEGSLVVCVADVSGHGIPAALLMSNLQAAVRMLASYNLQPKDVCSRLNALILEKTLPDRFITLFYGVLDLDRKNLAYTNAGHCTPVVFRSNGDRQALTHGGIPIGMLPDYHFEQGEVHLNDGDSVIVYTDGLIEARNADSEQFGEARVLRIVESSRSGGSGAVCGALLEAVTKFSDGMYIDDLALLVLSSRPHSTLESAGTNGAGVHSSSVLRAYSRS